MKRYTLDIRDNVLTFRTPFYKAERQSILHSGIFNRELASSITAGAVILALMFFFADKGKISIHQFIVAVLLFIGFFLFFRAFIFRDRELVVVFDKKKRSLQIVRDRVVGRQTQIFSLDALTEVAQQHFLFKPENPDGVSVVEKIALQHHTVIPGFGEETEFHTVTLVLNDGTTLTVFAAESQEEADTVTQTFNHFIEGK